jgi:SAM-dependent methyltransferase
LFVGAKKDATVRSLTESHEMTSRMFSAQKRGHVSNASRTRDAVGRHYGTGELAHRIRQALQNIHSGALNSAELAPIDQFHVGGLAATKEMADALGLRAGATVLDIGCGLGGSARFLAANYRCLVTGIDLNESFIEVARLLTQSAALDVVYELMDALNLKFDDNSFDFAWTQHVAMNIQNRGQLYANVHRVLKPGGRFAMYDVTAVDKGALVFPVPWARTPDISFLLTQQQMGESLRDAGFAEVSWIDRTASGIKWFDEQQSSPTMAGSQSSLGLHLVMGAEFPAMAANLGRNLKEGRAGLVQVIVEKPTGDEI